MNSVNSSNKILNKNKQNLRYFLSVIDMKKEKNTNLLMSLDVYWN